RIHQFLRIPLSYGGLALLLFSMGFTFGVASSWNSSGEFHTGTFRIRIFAALHESVSGPKRTCKTTGALDS
ncbi:MAG TPA: hypothetical protein VGF53_01220, partial [Pseudolabrys sp.]